MSSDSSQSVETVEQEELSKNVGAIERETSDLVTTLGRARRTRQCLSLFLLLLIVAVVVVFYRLGDRLRSRENTDALLTAAEKQLTGRSDILVGEVQKLVESSAPVLGEALSAQLQKDMGKYEQALDRERQVLGENLQQRLQERVSVHQKEILDRHEAILREEFPQFEDKQTHAQMIANMQLAMQPLVKKYYIDRLGAQLEEMYELWNQFPVADPVRKGEPPLDVVLVGQLMELLAIKFASQPNLIERESGVEKPAKAPIPEKAKSKPPEKTDEQPPTKADEEKPE